MQDVRKTAVASLFYPDDSINLKRLINQYLSNVPAEDSNEFLKKNNIDHLTGIIVPHAGYIYSGSVAAYGYSLLKNKSFDTVILIGPSHFTHFEGFALSYYQSFATPMGEVDVDQDLTKKLVEAGSGVFDYVNSAHGKEHSLEVQLPFLKNLFGDKFKIVPILMGQQTLKNVQEGAEILHQVLKKEDKQ